MILADRLTELIAASGLAKSEVARRAGFKRPDQLYQILNGDRPNPSAETLIKLLLAIGQPWGALDGVDSVGSGNVR